MSIGEIFFTTLQTYIYENLCLWFFLTKVKDKDKIKTRNLYICFNFSCLFDQNQSRTISYCFPGIARCKDNPCLNLYVSPVLQSFRRFDLTFSTPFRTVINNNSGLILDTTSEIVLKFVSCFVGTIFRNSLSRITHVSSSTPQPVPKSFRNLSCALSGNWTSSRITHFWSLFERSPSHSYHIPEKPLTFL